MTTWNDVITTQALRLALPVRIRQIPAQLLKFPVGVLRVKVAGFKPASVNAQEDVLPYCPEWSLKATLEMINLLQTSIRASVVVRNVPPFVSAVVVWCLFFTVFVLHPGL